MALILLYGDMIKHLFIGFPVQKPDSEEHRNLSIYAIVLASSILISGFIIVNYLQGHYFLMAVEVVSLLLFLLCVTPFAKGKYMLRRNMIVAASSILLLGLLMDGGIAKVAIFWSLLIPFIACLFLGLPKAWYWIAGYAAVAGVMIILHLLWQPFLPYDNRLLAYFPFVFFQFSILAAILQSQFEWSEFKHQKSIQELDELSRSLEDKVAKRTHALESINRHLKKEMLEHDKTAQALRDSEIQVYQMQKMETIGTLVGGIAHDFNNMLAGINANMFMIKQKVVDMPDLLCRTKDVEQLVMNASDMVKQLLTFARKDHIDFETFDLVSFLDEAYKLSEVAVSEHITMRFHNYRGQLPVSGNKTQIQQVLMNMINNARDAVKGIKKPAILIALKQCHIKQPVDIQGVRLSEGHYAVVSIRDNGHGIAEDKISKIFEPFYTTKEVGKGTGLGLAMCFGAIQSHGGVIRVRSKVGKGTIFEIFIPIAKEEGSHTTVEQGPLERLNSEETILLVDDDKTLRESQADALESIGYRVITAKHGKEALHIYTQSKEDIDVIVTDMTMPVMGGVEAVEKIRAIAPDVKVVFITGYDKDSTFNGGVPKAGEVVLEKPCTMFKLHETIQRVLQS